MSKTTSQARILERMPTGIAGLDRMLNGGLFRRGIYLITGVPGTGKTILGNQIAFNRVAAGEQVIYMTLLAESHADLFAYLDSLTFFDRGQITKNLFYFDGYDVLEKEGLKGLRELIRKTVFDKRPSLLVIDTFVSAEFIAETDIAFRKFIKEIHMYTQAVGCTTLLLTHSVMEDRPQAERTMMDGLIELTNPVIDERGVRYLQVQKLRGSVHLQGRHLFEIMQDGFIVHPRTEALFPVPSVLPPSSTIRLPFKIANLDAMLDGGLLESSVTMVLGTPGAGKTVLGNHFLAAGAQLKQPGVYFGFYEMAPYIIQSADQLGFNFSEHIKRGFLEVIWRPPQPDTIDAVIEQLLQAVRRNNVKRLVIDGLAGLKESTDNPNRFKRILVSLTNELRALKVTVLIAVELPNLFGPTVELPTGELSTLVDNIIFLRPTELHSHLQQVISILKMRNSFYDRAIRKFYITDHGIEVDDIFEPAHGILTGLPQTKNSAASAKKRSTNRSRKQ